MKTPEGSFTTASSFCSSTIILRRVLCAFDEPKSTPSGTMTAARPPGLSSLRKSARKSSSVFFVLTTFCRSLAVASWSRDPAKGGFARIREYFSASLLAPSERESR